MKLYVCIFLGAGLGAVARFALHALCSRYWPEYPVGTLIVNLLGCLVMGGVLAWAVKSPLSPEARGFWAVGLLGGFTTFSAFAGESLQMLQRGALMPAFGYALASTAGCIAACAGGFVVTSRLLG